MMAAVEVEVFICGSPDRGDDGAAMTACEAVVSELPPDVRVRAVGQLDVDDLLAVPPQARVVIVDVATGIEPGTILELRWPTCWRTRRSVPAPRTPWPSPARWPSPS